MTRFDLAIFVNCRNGEEYTSEKGAIDICGCQPVGKMRGTANSHLQKYKFIFQKIKK